MTKRKRPRKANHPVRLSVPTIKTYKPGKNDKGEVVRREIFDTGAPGLVLIIEPSGRRTFAFRAKRSKKTLGPCDLSGIERKGIPPEKSPHTLSQARAHVALLQQRLQAGEDVFGSPSTAKADGLAYPDAVKQYIRNKRAVGLKSKGWIDSAAVLGLRFTDLDSEPTLIPGGLSERWRSRATSTITAEDLDAVINEALTLAIPGKEPRNRKHSHGRARIMAADIGAMFKWLHKKSKKWVAVPITIGLDRPPQFPTRARVLSDQELKQVLVAAKTLGAPWHQFIWTLAATGQRLREVSMMTRDELDLTKGIWSLSESRTKNGRAHNVPLPPLVLDLIKSLPEEGPFVFSTTHGRGPIKGFSDLKGRINSRVQIAPWRFHDLRRSFITGAIELGIQEGTIEASVNHISGVRSGVAGVYNHAKLLEPRRKALERWASHIKSLVKGKKKSSNVVEIMRAG